MSDHRTHESEDWEVVHVQDASSAFDSADAAVAHADATMQELIEASRDMAASSKAVETLTREALIVENKRVRRHNNILMFLTCALLVGVSYMVYRDTWVSGPQREDIAAITSRLEECTTPGPREPTPDNPSTGHKCFDDAQERTAKAIGQIIDADQNGRVDSQEILDFLGRFEVFLPLADDLPDEG